MAVFNAKLRNTKAPLILYHLRSYVHEISLLI